MSKARARVHLSPPQIGALERAYVLDALDSGWVAPIGPHVDALEREFCQAIGCEAAVALNAGTAAIHLALILSGVGPGDEVAVSTATFVASANPILYCGAAPIFVGCEDRSWNMDPEQLSALFEDRARRRRPAPKAVIAVHLYGQCADLDAIASVCDRYGAILIEDAAEALGSSCRGRAAGSVGRFGAFSLNGNKIVTCGGGGVLTCREAADAQRARQIAAQAREPVRHYEHREIGYNYRLSNVSAAIARAQLATLSERVERRRQIFHRYAAALADLDWLSFAPEAPWGEHTRWLTCALIGPGAPLGRDELLDRLDAFGIEAAPLWKPMHVQPLFAGSEVWGGARSEQLFASGLCLPSGGGLSIEDQDRVIEAIRSARAQGG